MTFSPFKKLNDSTNGSIYLLLEIVFTLVFISGVPSLYYSSLSVPFFWCGYLLISFLTILNITSDSSNNQKLAGIILYSLSIHLIVPLVQPVGVVWDTDAVYTTQAAQLIKERKTWIPKAGTGDARRLASNYPSLILLEVYLSYITSIEIYMIQQYLMLIFSPLFLTGLFLFMRKATGNSDLAILSAFLFATNSIFEFYTTYTAYQGLGYVFVPLVLMVLSSRHRQVPYLFLVFSIALTLTHHWSSYNLIAFLVIVGVLLRLCKGKSINFNMRSHHRSIIFLVVIVASWQLFVATSTVSWQIGMLSEVVRSLLQLHTAAEGELQRSFGPEVSLIEFFFNYLGLVFFVCLSLLGSITSLKRKQKLEAYLFVFGIGVTFLNFYVFPWHLLQLAKGLRHRILDYAYFYLIPAVIVGISQLRKFLSHRIGKNEIYVFSLLILLLAPSTIITQFQRFYYTAPPPMEGTEWMTTARWVSRFASPNIVILGGRSAYVYIGGVAVREIDETHLLDVLDRIASGLSEQACLAVIDNAMLRHGGSTFFNFTTEDLDKAQAHLNLIYSNGPIALYQWSGKLAP